MARRSRDRTTSRVPLPFFSTTATSHPGPSTRTSPFGMNPLVPPLFQVRAKAPFFFSFFSRLDFRGFYQNFVLLAPLYAESGAFDFTFFSAVAILCPEVQGDARVFFLSFHVVVEIVFGFALFAGVFRGFPVLRCLHCASAFFPPSESP